MKILQIVGYKNSGKTTLMTRWISVLKQLQKTVVTMKHHGHADGLAMPDDATDSMRYIEAGADCSIVADGALIQLHHKKEEGHLEQMLAYAKLAEAQVILIEGYKNEPFPKVVIVQDEKDWATLRTLTNITAVFTWPGVILNNVQSIQIDDQEMINDWLMTWLEEGTE